jgi:hypothetical protein
MNQTIKLINLLLLITAITLTGIPAANADYSGNVCVNAQLREIRPGSIGLDEEFVLGVNLESCGSKAPQDITFEIISLPPDIMVTESMVTRIPELTYSTSQRYLTYHMRTTPDAKPGPHLIKMKLTYANTPIPTTKYYEAEVWVIGENAEPRISSVKTDPEYIYQGDTVDLRLGIENFGKTKAKSVSVNLDHNFKGIKDSTIGTIGVNASQTALFKFKADRSGDFKIPVLIEYEDDYGKQVDEYDIRITVLDKKGNLNLASVKVNPVLPYQGDTVELTLRIENSGDRTINSIRVYTDHPFKGLKESFIGTLSSNEDGPAVITFIADRAGEYEIPVTITYSDDFGEEQIERKINLIVLESSSNTGTVITILLILMIIGGLVYNNYRTKKSKDEVIKQLMEGSGNSVNNREQ